MGYGVCSLMLCVVCSRRALAVTKPLYTAESSSPKPNGEPPLHALSPTSHASAAVAACEHRGGATHLACARRSAPGCCWPALVDRLAATLEHNLETDPATVAKSERGKELSKVWRRWFPIDENLETLQSIHEVDPAAGVAAALQQPWDDLASDWAGTSRCRRGTPGTTGGRRCWRRRAPT
jgi:hypothetical protein